MLLCASVLGASGGPLYGSAVGVEVDTHSYAYKAVAVDSQKTGVEAAGAVHFTWWHIVSIDCSWQPASCYCCCYCCCCKLTAATAPDNTPSPRPLHDARLVLLPLLLQAYSRSFPHATPTNLNPLCTSPNHCPLHIIVPQSMFPNSTPSCP